MSRTFMDARKSLTLSTVVADGSSPNDPEMLITTSVLDRQGDELLPEGCDFAAYLRNPVVLFGHNQHDLPVGSTTILTMIPDEGIRARWRWLEGDSRAARVRNAYEQGVLRAASIGFLPIKAEPIKTGYRFTKWELLEFSLVPVPANPDAVRMLKHLGLVNPNAATAPVGRVRGRGTVTPPSQPALNVVDVESGARAALTPDELNRTVRTMVHLEMGKRGLLGATSPNDELELTEDELAEIIRETVRNTLQRGLRLPR